MSLNDLNKKIFELEEENKKINESISAIPSVKSFKDEIKENKDIIKDLKSEIKSLIK